MAGKRRSEMVEPINKKTDFFNVRMVQGVKLEESCQCCTTSPRHSRGAVFIEKGHGGAWQAGGRLRGASPFGFPGGGGGPLENGTKLPGPRFMRKVG